MTMFIKNRKKCLPFTYKDGKQNQIPWKVSPTSKRLKFQYGR